MQARAVERRAPRRSKRARRRGGAARRRGALAPAHPRDGHVRQIRPRLGVVPAAGRQPPTSRSCSAPSCPWRSSSADGEHARAPARQPQRLAEREPRHASDGRPAHASTSARRAARPPPPARLAEEAQRHVQRLRRDGAAAPPRPRSSGAAPADERRHDRAGQVERDEQPCRSGASLRRRARRAAAAAAGAARRVVVRSRTSGREPGRSSLRAIRAPSRSADATPRARARPASPASRRRAGDAGDADADVGAEARERAVGERVGDLGRDGAEPRDQLRGRRPPARSSPRSSTRPRRPARTPTSPAGRSAGPPAARRCTTRRPRPCARGGPLSSAATCSSIVVPSSENSCARVALAHEVRERRVGVRRAGLVQRRDLDLAAPQAGRDLQRREVDPRSARRRRASRRSPTRGSPSAAGSPARTRSRRRSRRGRRPSRAPCAHIGCSSRGGPGSTTTVGRRRGPSSGGTTTPGAVPTGSSTVAPSGTCACLRVPRAIAARSMFGQRSASGATIAAMRCSSASSSTIARPANSATTSRREVVGGRAEAAARHDQVDALGGEEAQRRRPCPRAGRRRSRCAQVDAQLAQALGQPRAVAVGDDPAEDLGPRDDDAGARAHVQVGAWSTGSAARCPRA